MVRQLLTEAACPLVSLYSDWKVEVATAEPFAESLIESLVESSVARVKSLFEGLATNEHSEKVLGAWKDSLVQELRESSKSRRLRVSGPAQIENHANGNGRSYPTALWDAVLAEDSGFTKRLRNRQVLGELEHPAEGNTKLPRISHLVEDVWRKDGIVYAKHLILNTPAGNIIRECYENKIIPGVSSRGAGSTRQENGNEVVEASDFHLDTWDFVYQPSVDIARPRTGSLGESTSSRTTVESRTPSTKTTVPGVSLNMVQSVQQTSDVLARAETILSESVPAKLDGVLTLQERSVNFLTEMLSVDPAAELATQFIQTRSRLQERTRNLVGAARKIKEDDMKSDDSKDDDKKGDVPPQFMKKDGDDDNSSSDDDSKDDDDAGDEQTERLSAFIQSEGLEDAKIDVVIETLLNRLAESDDSVLQEKYDTAIGLGEELVVREKKLRENYERNFAKLREENSKLKKQVKTCEALLTAVVKRYRGEQVQGFTEAIIEDNPHLAPIRNSLLACESIGAARKLVEGVAVPIVESVHTDLPPVSARPSRQPAGTSPRASRSGNLMEALNLQGR